MPNQDKKIAIVILGYNSRPHLDDCLTGLLSLNFPKEAYQVFFFDNASVDDSVAYVRDNFPQVKVIINPTNLGFAGGNNAASQHVLDLGFDYLLLINDDTISDPDLLNKLLAVAEQNERIAAVQARLMQYPDKNKINSLGNQIHYLGFGYSLKSGEEFDNNLTPREITYGSGAALLIKKEALKAIGLFEDDFFMYHEDLDFGWRLKLAGWQTFLAPEALVYHKYKFAKSVRQYYWMERNRFICLLKNYKPATFILLLPALIAMELGLFFFAILRGFGLEKLKVYAYFLKPSSWHKIYLARQKTQLNRQLKDREVIYQFSGKIEFQEINNFILNKIANPIFNLYWQIVKRIIFW